MLQASAPMSVRRSRAKKMPAIAKGTEAAIATTMHCTAESAAATGSFSPMRRATRAVAPIESPMPTA
jgi:hypothetical protein